MLKRYFSFLLVLVLMLSCVNFTIYAEESSDIDTTTTYDSIMMDPNGNTNSFTAQKAAFIASLYAENTANKQLAQNFRSLLVPKEEPVTEMPETAEDLVEEIIEPEINFSFASFSFPQFYQNNYREYNYGEYGTIASHGCGITCLAMVATYLKDEWITPIDMAEQFGNYNTPVGSLWILFEDSAKKLDLNLQERTYDWSKVRKALENGQCVISLQTKGLFTSGGHFICLFGLTEDNRITVYDPNSNNQVKNKELIDGFRDGFTDEQITENGVVYWIYGLKTHTINDISIDENP